MKRLGCETTQGEKTSGERERGRNDPLPSETIDKLRESVYTYQNSHDVIIIGDFNENAKVKSSSNRNVYLHRFIEDKDFVTRATEHTFIHLNGRDVSTIDFFLFKCHMEDSVLHIKMSMGMPLTIIQFLCTLEWTSRKEKTIKLRKIRPVFELTGKKLTDPNIKISYRIVFLK